MNNVPITDMIQRGCIIESSETNRRDIHKIYLLKEVYIKVHRNSDDGAAPSSWEGGKKEARSHRRCHEELLKNLKHRKFEC